MTDGIEPVFTPEEWAGITGKDAETRYLQLPDALDKIAPARAIAIANSLLPANDPRKITREMVDTLRALSVDANEKDWHDAHPVAEELARIAAALESYLPPESP